MAIDIRTQYITPDDFKVYFGIDLDLELKNSGNPSNTAQAFIKRIEDRMATYLNSQFFRKIESDYPKFSDNLKLKYQKALLEQAMYVFKNGDIIVDSGYDYDKGVIADTGVITAKWLAPMAKQYLMECGLLSRQIKTSRCGFRMV